MSSSVFNQNIPLPTVPLYDAKTGVMHLAWYRFFLSLFERTGGAIGALGAPGGLNGNIQFNDAGTFGGLSNIQVTARIQNFTSTLSGAVPASGGGATKFLNADAGFTVPAGTAYSAGTGIDLTGTTFSLQVPVTVAHGGTGLISGTSGGVLGYTASGTLASSAALGANQIVLGGGAGATPSSLGSLGTTVTVLHGNVAGAPTFGPVSLSADVTGTLPVANGGTGLTAGTSGGILGYTASGTLASSTALTQHALVIGGGAGATPTPLASLGTAATVLHGNATGDPTFGAVDLTADVTGTLPVANGGTGVTSSTGSSAVVLATNPTLSGVTVDGNGTFRVTSQSSGAGASGGTLTNAPSAGNPAFWLQISINGATRYVPAWS